MDTNCMHCGEAIYFPPVLPSKGQIDGRPRHEETDMLECRVGYPQQAETPRTRSQTKRDDDERRKDRALDHTMTVITYAGLGAFFALIPATILAGPAGPPSPGIIVGGGIAGAVWALFKDYS